MTERTKVSEPEPWGTLAVALAVHEFGVIGGLAFVALAVAVSLASYAIRLWWAARRSVIPSKPEENL